MIPVWGRIKNFHFPFVHSALRHTDNKFKVETWKLSIELTHEGNKKRRTKEAELHRYNVIKCVVLLFSIVKLIMKSYEYQTKF